MHCTLTVSLCSSWTHRTSCWSDSWAFQYPTFSWQLWTWASIEHPLWTKVTRHIPLPPMIPCPVTLWLCVIPGQVLRVYWVLYFGPGRVRLVWPTVQPQTAARPQRYQQRHWPWLHQVVAGEDKKKYYLYDQLEYSYKSELVQQSKPIAS